MNLVLLSDFIEQNELVETSVYAYLQELKTTNFDKYINLIKQNEFNQLLIDVEQAHDLLQALVVEPDKLAMFSYFKEALAKSEARYQVLFEAYLKLNKQLQIANENLLQVTMQQQDLIKEQIDAVKERDPRSLVRKLMEIEEREIDERLKREEAEDEMFRIE